MKFNTLNYWQFYLDHTKPWWQDFVAAAAFPVMAPISILGAGCTDAPQPDRPLIFPPALPPSARDASVPLDANPTPHLLDAGIPLCTPDPCDGVVLKNPNKSICLSFTESSQSFGLSSSPMNGFVVGDYDGDRKKDILFLNKNQPNTLFKNLGSRFEAMGNLGPPALSGQWLTGTSSTAYPPLFLVGESGSALFLNNRGRMNRILDGIPSISGTVTATIGRDILIGSEDGLHFLKNRGGLNFDLAMVGLVDFGSAKAIEVADLNGDGLEDVFVANELESDALFYQRPDGTFERAENNRPDPNSSSTDVEVVRFHKNQRHPFIYITRSGYGEVSNLLLKRKADGTYEDKAADYRLASPGHTSQVAVGFPAGEGWPVFFMWQGSSLVYLPIRKIENDGVVEFLEASTSLSMHLNGNIVEASWFDANGDGKEDLLVTTSRGEVSLFINETTEVTTCD